MTDRELLEMAAKAAGIDAEFHPELGYGPEGMWLKGDRSPDNSKYWNPLNVDGDALRLAVKLRLVVHVWDDREATSAAKTLPDGVEPDSISEDWFYADAHASGGVESATRRAIVRAAAEIGKAMP